MEQHLHHMDRPFYDGPSNNMGPRRPPPFHQMDRNDFPPRFSGMRLPPMQDGSYPPMHRFNSCPPPPPPSRFRGGQW